MFVMTFLVMWKNSLIRKPRLFPKFMSQPGKQTITVHVLANVSSSTWNQSVKFGHLIEHNMGSIFLQKLCRKWSREIISKPSSVF